jgi:hypothetical protein
MYAQRRSLDDYEAMRRDPGPVRYLQDALGIKMFEPGIYDVVESFAPLAASSVVRLGEGDHSSRTRASTDMPGRSRCSGS